MAVLQTIGGAVRKEILSGQDDSSIVVQKKKQMTLARVHNRDSVPLMLLHLHTEIKVGIPMKGNELELWLASLTTCNFITVQINRLDLLQVNLLASGASLVWPRSGRPRATKSRDYEIRRNLVPRAFPLKNGWGGKRSWHRLVTCTA